MKPYSKFLQFFLLSLMLQTTYFAQKRVSVNSNPQIVPDNLTRRCKELDLGKNIKIPQPVYPTEAKTSRIGGAVEIDFIIDERGKVSTILNISGHKLLRDAALISAREAVFTPSICDGVVTKIKGRIIFNFVSLVYPDSYFIPESIEDFSDVRDDSNFYEPLLYLTENYGLAFGYADKKFHTNAPLTKGDFIHFLRLTLDFLQKRSEMSNKIPHQIGLFTSYNPQKLASADEIKDFQKDKPYSESIQFLISKYNISLTDKYRKIRPKYPLTQNEVIDYWTKIFGKEAVPVNFKRLSKGDKILTRGEFAIYLRESLYVLTYKVLP